MEFSWLYVNFPWSMWILLVIVYGIFVALCEFSVIYVNSFGDRLWNFRGSMWIFRDLCEFFWVIVYGIFVALCEFSVIYENSFGDRLWNFRGSVWIFRDLCEFYVQLANCLVVGICMWPFRPSSSVYFSAGCWTSLNWRL